MTVTTHLFLYISGNILVVVHSLYFNTGDINCWIRNTLLVTKCGLDKRLRKLFYIANMKCKLIVVFCEGATSAIPDESFTTSNVNTFNY